MCPKCHQIVQLITGKKRPYFRHIGVKSNLQAESAVHLAGKKWLANTSALDFWSATLSTNT